MQCSFLRIQAAEIPILMAAEFFQKTSQQKESEILFLRINETKEVLRCFRDPHDFTKQVVNKVQCSSTSFEPGTRGLVNKARQQFLCWEVREVNEISSLHRNYSGTAISAFVCMQRTGNEPASLTQLPVNPALTKTWSLF